MTAPMLKTWTRAEYENLVDLGLIRPDDRTELLDGLIVTKLTRNPPHFTALGLADHWLRSAVGSGFHVRNQGPIALSDMSEPEPDLVVARGSIRDFAKRHPSPEEVELLVEVSHSSVDRDRRYKAPLYAKAGIKELWMIDIDSRRLEVHRDPTSCGFQEVKIFSATETAAPIFNPDARVTVADLLPPAS